MILQNRQLHTAYHSKVLNLTPQLYHILVSIAYSPPHSSGETWSPIALPTLQGFSHLYICHASSLCFIMISDKEGFFPCHSLKTQLLASEIERGLEYPLELDFLRDFVFVRRKRRQVSYPIFRLPYSSSEERRRLYRLYSRSRDNGFHLLKTEYECVCIMVRFSAHSETLRY